MTKFSIKVVSDTVCPWCYVGKRKLEAGISAYKTAHPDSQDTFDIEWLPFYLNPAASDTPAPKNERIDAIYGVEKRKAVQARLGDIGRDLGINFKFGGMTGKTRNSHRLIELAKTKGQHVQDSVVDSLFAAYFENEADITDKSVLKAAGVKGGLDEAEVEELLQGDRFGSKVDEEVQTAQKNLITGVPNFTFNDKYEIPGAQDAEGFKRVLEKIKELEE